MAREDLLNFIVSLALRPHGRCLCRASKLSQRGVRHVSTSNSPPSDRKSSLPRKKEFEIEKSTIPLHVGLDRNPGATSAISKIPIPRGEKGEKFTPSVLSRPLGLPHPPRPGQNSPIDTRTLQERREEFASYEKALERRRVYLRTFFRPYFQEWRRVDFWKGKSFVSNDRLFKREKALYFPNIWGQTLSKEGDGPDGGRDTTPLLMGKISIIGFQSGQWAEEQVDTFLSAKHNPELNKMIEESNGQLQRLDVNIQGDWMRAFLVKLFSGRLRKMVPEHRWDRYFMIKLPRDIRRGLTDEIRDAMGLLNSQVGYVYLVDSSCKIRWAGSGHAWKGEVEGLNAAVQRLVLEEQNLQQSSSKSGTVTTGRNQRTAPNSNSNLSTNFDAKINPILSPIPA
ncbi:uncharacterized protein Z518_05501 [Rhinocladiella mackenziei CBS 650.93]|uniref:Mitochondrial ATPase complex subunit ATP10 n=1 Tax=Rhinocladiella mackenziei CBS 650.93 TaxID=1442369 RepID=A0A0D2INC6_9EURO|nr:uncharacterized protein Z518_05501 [Rhinocladiella mackenziei CBS 650.93]KIX04631.1 hypothetical protein Z518_05501 [Rhinocladiella mackenziei CBS 650.93]